MATTDRLKTSQLLLTYRLGRGSTRQIKVISSPSILDSPKKHSQNGLPSSLGTAGPHGCSPIPELPIFQESSKTGWVLKPWRWHVPSGHIGVPTPIVGSCSFCLGCYPVWLANVQAVTVIQYSECHPWHLPKFFYGVSDSWGCHKMRKNKFAAWMNNPASEITFEENSIKLCLTQCSWTY